MFDCESYLKRLGVSASPQVNVGFLNRLIYAHQCCIPFEDIDIYDLHLIPSLEEDALYEKIIIQGRGGFCFELNRLFCALLRRLGFSVQPCVGRVFDNGILCPINHGANIVTLPEGRFFVDVGLGGPMPPFAVLMDGSKQCFYGETYWVEPAEESEAGEWLWLKRFRGHGILADGNIAHVEAPVLMFSADAISEGTYERLSREQTEGDEAPFRMERLVNLRTIDGYKAITNDTFIHSEKGSRKTEPIVGNLEELLRIHFGIDVDLP